MTTRHEVRRYTARGVETAYLDAPFVSAADYQQLVARCNDFEAMAERGSRACARMQAQRDGLLAALRELLAAAGHDETLCGGERIAKRDTARLSAGRLNGAIVNAKTAIASLTNPGL